MKKYFLDNMESELQKIINDEGNVFGKLEFEIEVFQDKEYVIYSHKKIEKLRYMIKGKAKITMLHEDGKQSIVHFVKPKEYIGELTFLGIEKQHKNVISIGESIWISVSMDKAIEFLQSDAEFMMKLSRYIGVKLLNRTWFSSKNQNYELKNRLAAYILMAENNGFYKEKHTMTAEFLGVSYRHLLYVFKSFVEQGLIEKYNNRYLVNIEELKFLAKDIEIV